MESDCFGYDVAIIGDECLVTGKTYVNGFETVAVRYRRDSGGLWVQTEFMVVNTVSAPEVGVSLGEFIIGDPDLVNDKGVLKRARATPTATA